MSATTPTKLFSQERKNETKSSNRLLQSGDQKPWDKARKNSLLTEDASQKSSLVG
jgi:hypothetical protein